MGAPDAGGGEDAAVPDLAGADATRVTLSGTFLLTLDAGAFPPTTAHPSALVYLPGGFDPLRPLELFVYIHGHNNCVENIVRDAGQPCTPGGPVRSASALAAQVEASGRNVMLLCPEVAFDQASGNPGALDDTGALKALVDEVLRDLPAPLASRTSDDVARLVVASHSGGYQVAAAVSRRGGLKVDELWLLDSLYGFTADFDAWVNDDLAGLGGSPPARRFADVYTTGGGTLANSQAMAVRARNWVAADGGILVDDRTTATWPDDTYQHGLLFKLSGLSHDGITRYYVERLLSTGRLSAK
jgi:hypothetical protein